MQGGERKRRGSGTDHHLNPAAVDILRVHKGVEELVDHGRRGLPKRDVARVLDDGDNAAGSLGIEVRAVRDAVGGKVHALPERVFAGEEQPGKALAESAGLRGCFGLHRREGGLRGKNSGARRAEILRRGILKVQARLGVDAMFAVDGESAADRVVARERQGVDEARSLDAGLRRERIGEALQHLVAVRTFRLEGRQIDSGCRGLVQIEAGVPVCEAQQRPAEQPCRTDHGERQRDLERDGDRARFARSDGTAPGLEVERGLAVGGLPCRSKARAEREQERKSGADQDDHGIRAGRNGLWVERRIPIAAEHGHKRVRAERAEQQPESERGQGENKRLNQHLPQQGVARCPKRKCDGVLVPPPAHPRRHHQGRVRRAQDQEQPDQPKQREQGRLVCGAQPGVAAVAGAHGEAELLKELAEVDAGRVGIPAQVRLQRVRLGERLRQRAAGLEAAQNGKVNVTHPCQLIRLIEQLGKADGQVDGRGQIRG